MAANFWASSHCASWLVDRSRVVRSNPRDLELFATRSDIWLLRRYFMDVLQELGLRLGLRQRIISTAQVFFKRFYLKASFVQFDPRLVAPTVLFVAAKVEETPINAKNFMARLVKLDTPLPMNPTTNAHGTSSAAAAAATTTNVAGGSSSATLVFPPAWLINASAPTAAAQAAAAALQAAVGASAAAAASPSNGASATPATAASSSVRNSSTLPSAAVATSSSRSSTLPPKVPLPYLYDVEDLLEMEFAVVSGLNYDFIVFHPYRPLMQFSIDMHHPELLQMSWEILNDAYRLDGLVLLHPPYMLALTALYIASQFQGVDYRPFFKTLAVEQEKILAISAEFLAGWDESEAYASGATQAKILGLMQKLNEKGFKTLAQMHAATAATTKAAATAATTANSGATAAAAAAGTQQNKAMAPPANAAAAAGHPAAPSGLLAVSHKRPAPSVSLAQHPSHAPAQLQPHLTLPFAGGVPAQAGMAPSQPVYSDSRDVHKRARN